MRTLLQGRKGCDTPWKAFGIVRLHLGHLGSYRGGIAKLFSDILELSTPVRTIRLQLCRSHPNLLLRTVRTDPQKFVQVFHAHYILQTVQLSRHEALYLEYNI